MVTDRNTATVHFSLVFHLWNSLSNHVISDESINAFKNRLGKFCPISK